MLYKNLKKEINIHFINLREEGANTFAVLEKCKLKRQKN